MASSGGLDTQSSAVDGAEFQLAEFLALQSLSDQVERFVRQAKANDFAKDKAQCQAWLKEAQTGSIRPWFRTVKSYEATTVRPFGHVEPGLRPFLRFIQWQQIRGASDSAIERVMPMSQQKAKEEAKKLKVLSGKDYLRRFRKQPNKAPGPDGWTVQVLRALPLQVCKRKSATVSGLKATNRKISFSLPDHRLNGGNGL